MHDSLLEDQAHLDDPHLWQRARAPGPRPRPLRGRSPLRGGRGAGGARLSLRDPGGGHRHAPPVRRRPAGGARRSCAPVRVKLRRSCLSMGRGKATRASGLRGRLSAALARRGSRPLPPGRCRCPNRRSETASSARSEVEGVSAGVDLGAGYLVGLRALGGCRGRLGPRAVRFVRTGGGHLGLPGRLRAGGGLRGGGVAPDRPGLPALGWRSDRAALREDRDAGGAGRAGAALDRPGARPQRRAAQRAQRAEPRPHRARWPELRGGGPARRGRRPRPAPGRVQLHDGRRATWPRHRCATGAPTRARWRRSLPSGRRGELPAGWRTTATR